MTTDCPHPIGTVCGCNTSDPCVTAFTIETPTGTHTYQGDGKQLPTMVFVDPLENGKAKGVDISVTLLGKCGLPSDGCPSGTIKIPGAPPGTGFVEALSDKECKSVTLFNKVPEHLQRTGLLDAFKLILGERYLSELPYTEYVIDVTQCAGHEMQMKPLWDYPDFSTYIGPLYTGDARIWIYPEYSWSSKTTLSFKKELKARADEARYEDRNAQIEAGTYTGLPMPEREIIKAFTITGEIGVNAGGYETTYASSVKASTATPTDRHHAYNLTEKFAEIVKKVPMLKAVASVLGKMKEMTYVNAGADKIELFSYDFTPPTISLEGKGKMVQKSNGSFGTDHSVGVGLKPIYGAKITLDLIQALAAYFKVGKWVKDIREEAAKFEKRVKEGNNGAYAGAELKVELASQLSTEGTISRKVNASNTDYAFQAETSVTIKGTAGLWAGTKVWMFEGLFKVEGVIIAEAKCALRTTTDKNGPDKEDKYVELVFYHEGIKANVEITVSGGVKNDREKNSRMNRGKDSFKVESNIEKKEKVYKEEWVWVDAVSIDQSDWKIPVFGKA